MNHFVSLGQLSPSLLKSYEPLDIPVQEQQELGYMMYRDDFERVTFIFSYQSFETISNCV